MDLHGQSEEAEWGDGSERELGDTESCSLQGSVGGEGEGPRECEHDCTLKSQGRRKGKGSSLRLSCGSSSKS